MLIRPLFQRYQRQLLHFCNTDHGKAFLVDNWGGRIEKSDLVIKVAPDGFHLLKDIVKDRLIIQATFFPCSPYLNKFQEILTYLRILEDNKMLGKIKDIRDLGRYIYLASQTFNPQVHPETTSVNGLTGRQTVTEIWATIISSAGNYASTNLSTAVCINAASNNASQFIQNYRAIFLFDTSSLTASAKLTSATYSLYTSNKNLTTWSMSVVSSTPDSNTDVGTADYLHFGSTRFATDIAQASVAASGYTDWALNATGIAAISKTAVSKFGSRMAQDIDNNLTWVTNTSWGCLSDYAVGTNKPKLLVNYTLPASFRTLLGVGA